MGLGHGCACYGPEAEMASTDMQFGSCTGSASLVTPLLSMAWTSYPDRCAVRCCHVPATLCCVTHVNAFGDRMLFLLRTRSASLQNGRHAMAFQTLAICCQSTTGRQGTYQQRIQQSQTQVCCQLQLAYQKQQQQAARGVLCLLNLTAVDAPTG